MVRRREEIGRRWHYTDVDGLCGGRAAGIARGVGEGIRQDRCRRGVTQLIARNANSPTGAGGSARRGSICSDQSRGYRERGQAGIVSQDIQEIVAASDHHKERIIATAQQIRPVQNLEGDCRLRRSAATA